MLNFCSTFFALLVALPAVAATRPPAPRDRLITYAEAEILAERAQLESEIPIVVNDQVLRQMNQMLASRSGRATLRRSLEAMEKHRKVVEPIFREYNLPYELLAIPIVESGYRNLPQSQSHGKSAGLWQFIRDTARAYGLKVNETEDERLDVKRATRAAAKYLAKLRTQFNDWHLVLAAYNRGEGSIENMIEANNGVRDPWQFAREKQLPDYLARMIVAMIALKDPSVLN